MISFSQFIAKLPIILVGIFVWINPTIAAESTSVEKPNVLKILNWSEYLDPEVIKEFENRFQATVKEYYFESDEDRTKKLVLTEGKGYDLIVSDMPSIRVYARRGWLEAIEQQRLMNYQHISPKYLRDDDGSKRYGIPLLWGTLGIAYRKDLVQTPITTWKQLFQPADELKNKIVLIRDVNDLIGMGLKSLGYSANSHEIEHHNRVQALLVAQKPYVRSYTYISVEEGSALLSGEVWAAMAYNGDALLLHELDSNVEYVVPQEGGNLWVDYFLVLKAAENSSLAYKFLDFINQPEVAKRIAEYASCATPNLAAEKLLPVEFKKNNLIYPPQNVVNNMEIYERLPARVVKRRNSIVTSIYN